MEYSAALTVSVLFKDHPETAQELLMIIRNKLPKDQLTDLSELDQIVASFQRARGLGFIDLTNRKGGTKISQERNLLIALLLLFYDPIKLMDLVDKPVTKNLLSRLGHLTSTSRAVLSAAVPGIVFGFKAYKEFRAEVYSLYETIKSDLNLFPSNNTQ